MIKMIGFRYRLLACVVVALSLAGCGGGGGTTAGTVSNEVASSVDVAALSEADLQTKAVPLFSNLSTKMQESDLNASITLPSASPFVDGSTVTKTYTPAQIRTAYQLPEYPSSWSNLSAAQAAKFGAGQTIYIVNAMHDPNIVAELSAFNKAFNLPACSTITISTNATLPLEPASSTRGCEFGVVYSSGGGMTSNPPDYDSAWAIEIALDVQWAHATAPLARIILIEAPSAYISDLVAAINLANAMGPGVVSMSFGAKEQSWMSSVDSAFGAANMTYLAATGDWGKGVYWPSASSQVLAVGGTTLRGFNDVSRDEIAWTYTGGGISAYVPVPSYQKLDVPGLGSQTQRNVADVAFNADPHTGQYTAVIKPEDPTRVQWFGVGGTSLSTPQWAGIVAVANATRAQNGQGPMGLVQNYLYQKASSFIEFFTKLFKDIISGSNGDDAKSFYDLPTGLGTPNATKLIADAGGDITAPVVSSVNISGSVGSAISFSMAYSSSNPVRWTLSGAPVGMTINSDGMIAWATPVAGRYAVTVTATDTLSLLVGTGTATISVTDNSTPVIETAKINGKVSLPLIYKVQTQSSARGTFSFIGDVPRDMTISDDGWIIWPKPVAGTYEVEVKVVNTKTAAVGTRKIQVIIVGSVVASGPVIKAPDSLTAIAGRPFARAIGISSAGASYVSVSVNGAPAGMGIFSSGLGIVLSWGRPVAGTYYLVITAKDSNNLSTQSRVELIVK